MLSQGFLGTRADWLVDIAFLTINLVPFIFLWSARLARAQSKKHPVVQGVVIVIVLLAVILFELDVRLSGGSGSLIANSPLAGSPYLTLLLVVHIGFALATYLGWAVLWVKSFRARDKALPGTFSARHKTFGRLIFAGTLVTALLVDLVYYLGFVMV